VTAASSVSELGNVVEVRGVHRSFERDFSPVRALRGADITIGRGEFVALMGPSGCGKSTLLNTIAGLEGIDEGTVHVAGHDLGSLDADERAVMRRKHVGIVFQFFNLLESMTVVENVMMPSLIIGNKNKAAKARALDLLDLLGIGDKASVAPRTLSGGQRQRLAIARAIANEPDVILADEPTGALDSDGGAEVLELFVRLNTQGQSILLVTHDQHVASVAGRIERMRDGVITTDALVG
jgi:putative ABC transport system ATP-binding protein